MLASPKDCLDRSAMLEVQREQVRALLEEILPRNRFYARKFAANGITPRNIGSVADLARLPFTTKAELLEDQQANPPFGTVLTYSLDQYCRMNQTSGTAGRPLRWLDTAASWARMLRCWDAIYQVVGLHAGDRLFFAFSFGPFLGFWTAFDAAVQSGYLSLPGGGMSSAARLRFLSDNEVTVVLCTPTYALHLAEVAREQKMDLGASGVRALIVAGEPGGSIPATRERIESAWGARVFDHSGLTEVGPMAIECPENPAGLHVLEEDYIIEVIDPASSQPVPAGQVGELVVTNLGRWGSPVIRYRTGDLVRVDPEPCPCGRCFLRLAGGILGRVDDMIHVRGNNVYPSALEAVIRRFPEVVEYRVAVLQSRALPELCIELEPSSPSLAADLVQRVDQAIREELLFRAEIKAVEPGTLPRFDMKAKRFIKHDGASP
jgi:phenylacetate-CoA ligase